MSAPPKIAYLVSQYPATSHTFIRREIAALRQRGVEIETFSVRRPGADELQSGPDRDAASETAYLLPASLPAITGANLRYALTSPRAYFRTLMLALRHRVPGARALLWSLFHFAEAMLLARLLERRGIAHVHNHFANSGATVGLLATRFLGLPWSLTLHGISETDYPAGLLLARKIEAADFVACVSWFGRAQAMRLVPPDHWNKFMIVRCGIETASLPSRLKRDAADSQRTKIICVGRLSDEKGQAGLIEAFASLLENGVEAELTLVGDGPNLGMLEQKSAALGVVHHVHFLGRLDEAATLEAIARSDLLVMSSFMEGLPVVLMEAMALRVPVIAPRVAGIPELVEHGQDGRLYTPGHWQELADAMRDFATRAGDDTMTQAAHDKIAVEFEIGRAVAPLLKRFAHPTARG